MLLRDARVGYVLNYGCVKYACNAAVAHRVVITVASKRTTKSAVVQQPCSAAEMVRALQAIDRTHRIGQSKGVQVTRIVVQDTVEDRILELQDTKREIIKAAFGSGGGQQAGNLTAADLQFLFS